MSALPRGKVERIEFAEDHVAPWTSNSVAIGSDAATVSAWSSKVTAARAAYEAQRAAKQAAKAATNEFHVSLQAMVDATADIIREIRTKAGFSGDAVYTLAEIPAPKIPGPIAAPGKPVEVEPSLLENGAIKLTWKCVNPVGCVGVVYQVWRRLGIDGAFVCLGSAGAKEFIDDSLPAGTAQVTYQLQAQRSTSVGPWAQYTVNFGVTTTVTEGTPTNLAA